MITRNAPIVVFILILPLLSCSNNKPETEKPNILWLVSEDNSPLLGCYGDEFATTPNLDNFAKEGILYTHAYANAPVCAPARSTIISGMYACSMGTEHMRSSYNIPEEIKFYPQYLREAGYYCTNNSKKDYNMPEPDSVWDESSKTAHYKNRPEGKPFFAIFNFVISHESSIHKSQPTTKHSQADVPIAPYHPDVPEVRHDWAQYYDKIEQLDSIIGVYLEELEEEGLADNTIVFYYSDHGGVLARSKRFLYETGTHVPLIIRFPEKYKNLAPQDPGTKTNRIVSFVDLAPTLLSLAGIEIPEYIQGEAFLGTQAKEPRDYAFMFRGRMDERYDMMRSVRNQKYRYIRNFMPQRIYGQHLNYLWKAPATQAWEREYLAGNCNEVQSIFWNPKPYEELYDTENDPWEINNLASNPEYNEVLEEMRSAYSNWVREIKDPGFIPEGQMVERFSETPAYTAMREPGSRIESIIQTAEAATKGKEENLPEFIKMMDEDDPAIRYWAVTSCIILKEKAMPAKDALIKKLDDSSGDVRVAAAEALYILGEKEMALDALKDALKAENSKVQLRAINVLQTIGEEASGLVKTVEDILPDAKDNYVIRAGDFFVETMK